MISVYTSINDTSEVLVIHRFIDGHIEGLELKRTMSTLVGFEIIEF